MMIRILLFAFSLVFVVGSSQSQIISQYYEGAGSDKWIEIYNPTTSSIDLSGLFLALFSNAAADNPGSSSPTNNLALSGMLASDATLLFQNSSAVLPSYASGTNASICNFNGDDLVIITSSNGANAWADRIDVVGDGSSWGSNTSLVRNSTINAPNTTWTLGEWTTETNAAVNGAGSGNLVLGTHSAVPLPVTLTAFNAKPTSNGAMLEWTTASEENNDYFSVEMSRDAARFSESAQIKGSGTTESFETYSYEYDNLTPGTYYFRLRQVDYDGQFAYSDVVSLTIEGGRDFVLFANTVHDYAQVEVKTPRPVRILNMTGATVAEYNLTEGMNTLDVSALTSGMYIISDGTTAKRFVK